MLRWLETQRNPDSGQTYQRWRIFVQHAPSVFARLCPGKSRTGPQITSISTEASMTATTIQQQQNIPTGDWNHLERVLKNVGLKESEVADLLIAIESEGDGRLKESD